MNDRNSILTWWPVITGIILTLGFLGMQYNRLNAVADQANESSANIESLQEDDATLKAQVSDIQTTVHEIYGIQQRLHPTVTPQ